MAIRSLLKSDAHCTLADAHSLSRRDAMALRTSAGRPLAPFCWRQLLRAFAEAAHASADGSIQCTSTRCFMTPRERVQRHRSPIAAIPNTSAFALMWAPCSTQAWPASDLGHEAMRNYSPRSARLYFIAGAATVPRCIMEVRRGTVAYQFRGFYLIDSSFASKLCSPCSGHLLSHHGPDARDLVQY